MPTAAIRRYLSTLTPPAGPDAAHVCPFGLASTDDTLVRQFAVANQFAVVTKDRDHGNLVAQLGTTPKVVWKRLGNCSARVVADAMRAHYGQLLAFDADPVAAVYELI